MFEADREAPVFAEDETDVAAAPEVLWDVMTAIDRWPEWNRDIKSARLEGELKEETEFRWKSGPGTITSTLRDVDPPRRIAWSGKTFGIIANHVWEIEPSEAGAKVRSFESWEGLPVRLFRKSSQRTVEKALRSGLTFLKEEAEARASA